MPAVSKSRKLKWAAFIAVDVLLAVFLVGVFLLREQRQEIEELRDLGATIYPQAQALRPFGLTTHTGARFTEADLQGRWSLVFYGFTHCPNVCPLTMVELARFQERLPADGSLPLPQVILATVDPARDTPARLTEYLDQYHETFIGLTGTDEALADLAGQLYVVAMPGGGHDPTTPQSQHEGNGVELATPGRGGFDHSGHISVINPEGELYAVLRLPHREETLLSAYRRLVSR